MTRQLVVLENHEEERGEEDEECENRDIPPKMRPLVRLLRLNRDRPCKIVECVLYKPPGFHTQILC